MSCWRRSSSDVFGGKRGEPISTPCSSQHWSRCWCLRSSSQVPEFCVRHGTLVSYPIHWKRDCLSLEHERSLTNHRIPTKRPGLKGYRDRLSAQPELSTRRVVPSDGSGMTIKAPSVVLFMKRCWRDRRSISFIWWGSMYTPSVPRNALLLNWGIGSVVCNWGFSVTSNFAFATDQEKRRCWIKYLDSSKENAQGKKAA